MLCIAQYYSESRVWLEFRVCNTPLFFQIEELKNDNALLRAQLQQHGIEVNGDATPQWRPTQTCATAQTRRRILPPTHTERETISNLNWTMSENGETRGWRRTLTDWNGGRGGGDTLRSVNRVANWTSPLQRKKKKKTTSAQQHRAPPNVLFMLIYEPATNNLLLTVIFHIAHRTPTCSSFCFPIFFFFTFAVLETTKCDMNDSSHFLFNLLDFKECVNIRRKADIGIYSCCKNNNKKNHDNGQITCFQWCSSHLPRIVFCQGIMCVYIYIWVISVQFIVFLFCLFNSDTLKQQAVLPKLY